MQTMRDGARQPATPATRMQSMRDGARQPATPATRAGRRRGSGSTRREHAALLGATDRGEGWAAGCAAWQTDGTRPACARASAAATPRGGGGDRGRHWDAGAYSGVLATRALSKGPPGCRREGAPTRRPLQPRCPRRPRQPPNPKAKAPPSAGATVRPARRPAARRPARRRPARPRERPRRRFHLPRRRFHLPRRRFHLPRRRR